MFFNRRNSIMESDSTSLFLSMKDLTLISHDDVKSYEIYKHCVVVYTTGGKYYYDAKEIESLRLSVNYSYSNNRL